VKPLKIRKIELEDYKLFKGQHIFEFSDRINLVRGPGGSGKTILFNALRENIMNEVPGVKVKLEGGIDEFRKNADMIFIDEKQMRKSEEAIQSSTNLSTGTKNLSVLKHILTRRESVNKNLPLIMDTQTFSILDQSNRDILSQRIISLETQIILFEQDFKGIKGDKEYNLAK